MTPCYIYVRFSSKKQEKGESRERQLEICRALAEAKGYEVVEVVEDLGKSAWSGAHLRDGSLGRFSDRVRAHEIERGAVLLVEKLDRLSRQGPRVAMRWMEDMCEAGLAILAADSPDRLYTDATIRSDIISVIEPFIKFDLGEVESVQKSVRVSHTKRKRFKEAAEGGKKITRKCPGWLILSEDKMHFTVREDRAELVREIYRLAAEGRGPAWIAKTLNERGIPAWCDIQRANMRPGWECSAVKLILRQPSVEGDYVEGFSNTAEGRKRNGERIVGYYEHRIVDAELVAKARASLDGRKLGGGRYRTEAANLFAGKLFCAECGGKLNMRSNQSGVRYLQCVAATRARGCTSRAMYRYEPFESAVLDKLLSYALDDRFFRAPEAVSAVSLSLADARKRQSDDVEKAGRLVDLLSRMASPSTEARLAALEGEISARATEIAKLETALAAARGRVGDAQHLARVLEVRDALTHADKATREGARLKVQEAMGSIISWIVAAERDDRSLTVFVAGGAKSIMIRDGAVVAETAMTPEEMSAFTPVSGWLNDQVRLVERRTRALP